MDKRSEVLRKVVILRKDVILSVAKNLVKFDNMLILWGLFRPTAHHDDLPPPKAKSAPNLGRLGREPWGSRLKKEHDLLAHDLAGNVGSEGVKLQDHSHYCQNGFLPSDSCRGLYPETGMVLGPRSI